MRKFLFSLLIMSLIFFVSCNPSNTKLTEMNTTPNVDFQFFMGTYNSERGFLSTDNSDAGFLGHTFGISQNRNLEEFPFTIYDSSNNLIREMGERTTSTFGTTMLESDNYTATVLINGIEYSKSVNFDNSIILEQVSTIQIGEVTSENVKVSWTPVKGAEVYRVCLCSDGASSSIYYKTLDTFYTFDKNSSDLIITSGTNVFIEIRALSKETSLSLASQQVNVSSSISENFTIP